MKEPASRRSASCAPLWRSLVWTMLAAAACFCLYRLHHHHVLEEQQLLLLLFLLVPISLFLLSGAGQDGSQRDEGEARTTESRPR